ncbi:hypothetical protein MSAN_01513500 [Mycena sanguinolenta]|uniref:Uncharacterized protein n=1 Tax=Mycena sanguinolenta TaxID=230812 RepID=A0A8H6Y7E1_9AGAR|nr:hypothetical protein MSAN_01513500 [Mycena sanguinolenta]
MEGEEALVGRAVKRVVMEEPSEFRTIPRGDVKLVKEECRKDVAKYESIWHPNIMQLYSLVSTKELHAMVFHDELIPFAEFFGCFRHSPILSIYIIGYCSPQFWGATHYIDDVTGSSMYNDNLIMSASIQSSLHFE